MVRQTPLTGLSGASRKTSNRLKIAAIMTLNCARARCFPIHRLRKCGDFPSASSTLVAYIGPSENALSASASSLACTPSPCSHRPGLNSSGCSPQSAALRWTVYIGTPTVVPPASHAPEMLIPGCGTVRGRPRPTGEYSRSVSLRHALRQGRSSMSV
jgi:hypothetical protein